MASLMEGTEPKKARTESSAKAVVIQLQSVEGAALGPQCNVPLDAGSAELEKLVNELKRSLGGGEPQQYMPYAFYAEGNVELSSLRAHIEGTKAASTEEVLTVTYEPLAVFRVRRVSRCAETMPGHTDAILHVTYSPDGKMLASGGGDATVRFWDALSATPKRTCGGHKNHVLCTAWAPDGSKFASGDKNGEVRLWDPKSGKCLQAMSRHSKWITSLAWCPLHLEGDLRCPSQLLASASKDTSIKLWNARTGAVQCSLTGHTDSVEAIVWAGETGIIFSASRDRSIKVWASSTDTPGDARSYRLVRTLPGHAHRVNTLALSSAHVLRTGPFDHKSGAKAFKVPTSLEEEGEGWVLARSEALKRFREFEKTAGSERLVSGSDDATLILWAAPTEAQAKPLRLTGHQQPVNAIVFSPDARKFASASFDKKVKLWHGRTGAFLATLTGHVAACYALAWSPDSRLLISASRDSTLKVWHAADDEKPPDHKQKASGTRKFATAMETLAGHHDEVFAVDWAPNGAHAASGSKDRTIKIWHA